MYSEAELLKGFSESIESRKAGPSLPRPRDTENPPLAHVTISHLVLPLLPSGERSRLTKQKFPIPTATQDEGTFDTAHADYAKVDCSNLTCFFSESLCLLEGV